MTELLQQAIAQIELLPPDQQDYIATLVLDELKDEQRWLNSFAQTTDSQWDQLVEMVRLDIKNGDTIPLEKVFPL